VTTEVVGGRDLAADPDEDRGLGREIDDETGVGRGPRVVLEADGRVAEVSERELGLELAPDDDEVYCEK